MIKCMVRSDTYVCQLYTPVGLAQGLVFDGAPQFECVSPACGVLSHGLG